MSIPPLVCSTPPPLDQCEDDKDIEEFDLRYRLSQEDDDDAYNYGNFSTYTGFNQDVSVKESPKHEVADTVLENIVHNKTESSSINSSSKDFIESKYDDVAIEDLNLNVEQDNIIVENHTEILNNVDDWDSCGIGNHSESTDKNIVLDNSILITKKDEDIVDELNISETNSLATEVKEETSTTMICNEVNEGIKSELIYNDDAMPQILEHTKCQPEEKIQDDFDDFEDFHFTTPILNNYEVIENDGNPWESKNPGDVSFGDFKANFDGGETLNPSNVVHEEFTNQQKIIENSPSPPAEIESIDDDFGDFDDFKSSSKEESIEKPQKEHISNVNILNLQCNDSESQVIESINNILFSIFTVDLPEPDTIFEESGELPLSETWHHLKEVDERQPYIVYWNNSLGQKSLLKALCIDSRNILFGSKWNNLMPKYANSLSVAPIKPQKPSQTQDAPQHTVASNSEKISKENTTWADPYTSNGQDYTYAEALLLDLEHLMATLDQMAHKQSTLKISELLSNASNTDREKASKETRPADLDVFGTTVSVTNIDKIHASTLSVQPLRHINLPDTHIFTPTDSETPRSKTIHYDNRPPLLIPQKILENNVNIDKSLNQHTNIENNDDYWEFQDFKGVSATTQQNTEPIKLDAGVEETAGNTFSVNSGITYQNQILQPVKLEPIMPTLNWPDPGEVKETFDDFSDFISNSSPSATEKKSVLPNTEVESKSMACENHVDDEFETFQSGPVSNNIKLGVSDNTSINTSISNKFEAVNSLHNQMDMLNLKTNESVTQSHVQNSMKNSMNMLPRTEPVSNINMLQHSGTKNLTQGGQILQPLSLESYSQINWPKPGIDLQNLSSFNPLESLQALKSDSSSSSASKGPSPVHNKANSIQNDISDDDIWGDFVSSKPKQTAPKKSPVFADDDEWTDFVSSPSISQISLNTISLNVQTNSNMQKNTNKNIASKNNQMSVEIPALNYITPKSNSHGVYIDKHFQNL